MILDRFRLDDRVVLVTGAGKGIGRGIARACAEAGAHLVLGARTQADIDAVAEEARGLGRRALARRCDVTKGEDLDALVEAALSEFGRVDVLVNNAGGQFPQPARHFKPKGWQAVIDTNLTGTWNVTQVFGNRMLDARGGAIVQIIAVVGRGFPGIAHTAAARAGVLELSRTLAYEWGPSVRVNCVAPGPVDTTGFGETYDPDVRRGLGGFPIPRFGRPHEVAWATTFLASPAASWTTGEILYVAGGQQLQGRNQALLDPQLGRPEE